MEDVDEQKYVRACCARFPQLTSSSHPAGGASAPSATLFEIVQLIGAGATGNVFLARRIEPERKGAETQEASLVAVKVVELGGKSESEIARCFTEIACLHHCSCFSILRIHADFRYPPDATGLRQVSSVAMVLDYANGGDLRREIKSRARTGKPFQEREVALMLLQLLVAMQYLHQHCILHRDVKSANILLCSNGLVKLCDFGFSKVFSQEAPSPELNVEQEEYIGTPFYVSPEVWLREPYGTKSDMYALGVVLYEVLMLRRPYEHTDLVELRDAVVEGRCPPVVNTVSADMRAIVAELMHIDPKQRADAETILRKPLMRMYVAALMEMAHDPETDIAPADRGRLIRGLKRYSCTLGRLRAVRSSSGSPNTAGLPKLSAASHIHVTSASPADASALPLGDDGLPSRHLERCGAPLSGSDLLGLSPSSQKRDRSFTDRSISSTCSDSLSVYSPNVNVAAGPAIAAAVLPDIVIREGHVQKQGSENTWKDRYLRLGWLQTPLGELELRIFVSPSADDTSVVVSRLVRDFEDSFRMPSAFLECAFALVGSNGRKVVFRCATSEEANEWISALETAFCQV